MALRNDDIKQIEKMYLGGYNIDFIYVAVKERNKAEKTGESVLRKEVRAQAHFLNENETLKGRRDKEKLRIKEHAKEYRKDYKSSYVRDREKGYLYRETGNIEYRDYGCMLVI